MMQHDIMIKFSGGMGQRMTQKDIMIKFSGGWDRE